MGDYVNWREKALCLRDNQDPDMWYPEGEGESGEVHRNNRYQAKKICKECPVRAECLKFAIDNKEQWGIWGGLMKGARQKLGRDLMIEHRSPVLTIEMLREWCNKNKPKKKKTKNIRSKPRPEGLDELIDLYIS